MAYNKEKNEAILNDFLSGETEDKKFIQKQMDIAAQIDTYLKENGWTRKDLAEKAGLHQSQITEIMAGEANPTLRTITKIEEALEEDIIVSPEFYKEEMEEKGWIRPDQTVYITAGTYRTEFFELDDFISIQKEQHGVIRTKRNQYNTASQMHIYKATGTHG